MCEASAPDARALAAKATAAVALAATVGTACPDFAEAKTVAPYAGLEPCAKSKAFDKREKKEIKGLQRRLKEYEADSAPALALNANIAQTKARFQNYRDAGLLCCADGLPHLIVDGNLEHIGEFTIPGLGFLYVAGWIGYAGRSYIMANKETAKPTEGEIIIDVPAALKIMFSSAGWPLYAVRELQKGTLTESAENITVSPR